MPSKLSKKVFPKGEKYDWLIQPVAFTFMRYDYSLIQQKIYAAIIDRLQAVFKEELVNSNRDPEQSKLLTINNSWRDYEEEFHDDERMKWDKENMSIPLKIKAKDFNVTPNHYAELRQAFVEFGNSPISIEYRGKKGMWVEYSCLCRMRVPEDLKRFTHAFAVFERQVAVEMLHAAHSGYTKFLKQVIMFSGCKYTSRFYFFLSAFRNKSSFFVPYEDLRLYLRLGVKYKEFYSLKRDVLDVVVSELRTMYDSGLSNLCFSYVPVYDNESDLINRKVTGISFDVIGESDSKETIYSSETDTTIKKIIYDHLILYCGCSEYNAKLISSKIKDKYIYEKAVELIIELDVKFREKCSSILSKERYTVKSFDNLFKELKNKKPPIVIKYET